MELLCAGVESDHLRMTIGSWKSDEMFRYLHVQAPIIKGLAAAMLRGGDFCLTPG